MRFGLLDYFIAGTLFGVVISVAGCGSAPIKTGPKNAPELNRPLPPDHAFYAPLAPSEGSLWTDAGDLLFVDTKARRAGDTITVDIIENTSSSMDVNTKASRSSSIDGSISHALGYMRALEAKNPNLNRDQDGNLTNKLFEASLANEFDGKGQSDRSGRVTASIGARVTEVLPNGNLFLYGRREMKVNNEVQYITVSGMVRPKDIGSDNRVKSTYLADARIEYFGKGVLADKQKPGWMSRIFDHIWPF